MLRVPEQYRVRRGQFSSDLSFGNNGLFLVPCGRGEPLRIVASDAFGWEHVSASFHDRTPTWDEMCRVKELFWQDDDVVVQYHPPRAEYINLHPHCLHLWRPVGALLPCPPSWMVGV